tara:strand:+ start:3095 stop:3268 length:174 start_codon:yes stop_codon:yes gene_type:complete
MHSIAILGFFSLVVVFFFSGKNDFGLKPTPKKNMDLSDNVVSSSEVLQEKELEEINN